jgi:hypothetical protein
MRSASLIKPDECLGSELPSPTRQRERPQQKREPCFLPCQSDLSLNFLHSSAAFLSLSLSPNRRSTIRTCWSCLGQQARARGGSGHPEFDSQTPHSPWGGLPFQSTGARTPHNGRRQAGQDTPFPLRSKAGGHHGPGHGQSPFGRSPPLRLCDPRGADEREETRGGGGLSTVSGPLVCFWHVPGMASSESLLRLLRSIP